MVYAERCVVKPWQDRGCDLWNAATLASLDVTAVVRVAGSTVQFNDALKPFGV